MNDQIRQDAEIFLEKISTEKIYSFLLFVLKRYEFKEVREELLGEKGFYKENIMYLAENFRSELHDKIRNRGPGGSPIKSNNFSKYMKDSIINNLRKKKDEKIQRRTFTINKKLKEKLRKLTGDPKLEITIENQEKIRKVYGFETAVVKPKRNVLEVFINIDVDKLITYVEEIEEFEGPIVGDMELGSVEYRSPEDIVIMKDSTEKLFRSLTVIEYEINELYYGDLRSIEEIAAIYGQNKYWVNEHLKEIDKKVAKLNGQTTIH